MSDITTMPESALASAPRADAAPQVHVHYARTPGHLAFEGFGIVAATGAVALLLCRAVLALQEANNPTLMAAFIGALLLGYILADFASGVVHFFFDRFLSIDTPVLGKNFVHPFRMHHSDPKDITRHGFIETNGNNSLATLPFLIALIVFPFDFTSSWQLFFVTLIVSGAIGTFLTNQFHKWAHSDQPPAWVCWLQDHHVILPRRHHQIHHTHPYDTHYCITTGWLNGVLGYVGFWRMLECFFSLCGLSVFNEKTPWEQVPGSPAFAEREHMASTAGR